MCRKWRYAIQDWNNVKKNKRCQEQIFLTKTKQVCEMEVGDKDGNNIQVPNLVTEYSLLLTSVGMPAETVAVVLPPGIPVVVC